MSSPTKKYGQLIIDGLLMAGDGIFALFAERAGTNNRVAMKPGRLKLREAGTYLAIGKTKMFELIASGPNGEKPVIASHLEGRDRVIRVKDLDNYIIQCERENG